MEIRLALRALVSAPKTDKFRVMTHLGFTQRSLRKKIAENAKGFYTFLCVLCDYFADFA